MSKEIINRVANSGLITLDFKDLRPQNKRVELDIKKYLFQELVLKEKDFRAQIKELNLDDFKGTFVHIYCSSEAIVPTWAYMLLASTLEGVSKKVVFGNAQDLEVAIFEQMIESLNLDDYKDQRVIIKGCSEFHIPTQAYVKLTEKLRPVVKSLMFGEACSTVPLYKKK